MVVDAGEWGLVAGWGGPQPPIPNYQSPPTDHQPARLAVLEQPEPVAVVPRLAPEPRRPLRRFLHRFVRESEGAPVNRQHRELTRATACQLGVGAQRFGR